ncbi:o-succinylbenzoate--CoA ligase [Leifsonia bigeumensis]|uniref:O-succinylbenzoate--CoA ligase n=1 Tax=Leifsonella bigeumensis TaxID=433643 RepID=A0ABP7FHR2_9MICO
MTRPLEVTAGDPDIVLPALRSALGGGPAIMPLPEGADRAGIPNEVPQRVALVVQTSGSTGSPKRVALSADALLASAAASEGALGGPGQWVLALPAHYIAGVNVLVRSIAAGTEPIILPQGHFDPHVFLEAAAAMDHPARYTSLVPAQLASLLGSVEGNDLDALETLRRFDRILVGGQSTPTGLLAQALELGLGVTRTYGSSETSGGCVYDGVPIGATAVRLAGDAVEGEIELGGPVLAEGYLGDDERTAASFYSDSGMRWYRTGDTGELVEGVLRVTGRLDDVIVSGGIKVSLAAVERIVRSLPGLSDAVVVPRANDRWGEVPIVATTASASPEGLLKAVRTAVGVALGPAARPAELVTVEAIPVLASGKPDRASLVARLAPPAG